MGDTPRPFKKMAGSVEVHYFPKRAARRRGTSELQVETRTLTIPEFALEEAEARSRAITPETGTEQPDLAKQRKKGKSGRRNTGSQRRRVTQEITLETEAPAPKVHDILRAKSPLELLRGLSRRQLTEVSVEGHTLFENGDLENARRIFEHVVALEPDDSFSYTMLGTIFLALGEQDRALALFEAALGVDKTDLAARVYRGEIRLHRGRYKLAIDDLQRALDGGDPQDPFVDRAKRLMKIARQALSAQQPGKRKS